MKKAAAVLLAVYEEEYPYTPLYMYDDATIIPVKGKLAVLGITRS